MFIFFDFDGLIADTEPCHMKSFDLTFQKLGIPLKANAVEWVGRGTREIIQEIIEETRTTIPFNVIYKTKRDALRELIASATLMPYAIEVLERLSRAYPLALVTSSHASEIDPILDRLNLRRFFRVRVFGNMVLRLKPHPDMYLLAMKLADVKHGIAVEDSEKGVAAAKAAGLYCIAVPNEYTKTQDLTAADQSAIDLLEVESLIRGHARLEKGF